MQEVKWRTLGSLFATSSSTIDLCQYLSGLIITGSTAAQAASQLKMLTLTNIIS